MSSILSGDFEVKVDTAYLRNNGFTCFYSHGKLATKFVNGAPTQDYHPHQKYWRWEDEDYNIDHYYGGYLYYFPEKFIGNTKSIVTASPKWVPTTAKQNVNTAKQCQTTVKQNITTDSKEVLKIPKVITDTVVGNHFYAVKASASWQWKP